MDTAPLVGPDLVAGRMIIQALEQRGIPVDVAAWLQDDDRGNWQLVISSPRAEDSDPRLLYREIRSILRCLPSSGIDLDDVLVTGPRDHLVKDLTRLVRTGDEPQEIRLHDLELGGRLFRSSRIYRAKGGQSPTGGVEYDARIRVKSNGRLGVVRGVIPTSSGPRYSVLYDLTPEDLDPALQNPPREAGGFFPEQELEFLYAVRPTGSPEKPPRVSRPA